MEYRRVGRSGLKISAISLGSWQTYGTKVVKDQAKACIIQAWDLGVNHFDCADSYGHEPGAAEEVLGELLGAFPRHEYVLSTKCFWDVGPSVNDRGLSRKHIMESVHRSLRRLKTDYIDIMYCHRYDPDTPVDETLRALDDLVRQGKVLYIGISEWTAAQVMEGVGVTAALGLHPITANQPKYNWLERELELEVMPACAAAGIGLIVWSPLAQGVLTGKYQKGLPVPADSRAADELTNRFTRRLFADEKLEQVEQFRRVASELGVSMAELALAWSLQRPEVTSALIGASRPEQVVQNVRALGVRLGAAELNALNELTPP